MSLSQHGTAGVGSSLKVYQLSWGKLLFYSLDRSSEEKAFLSPFSYFGQALVA